jgi:Fe-S cluster biogenesis protein NfuA
MELNEKIKKIIEEDIKPKLSLHGGGIEIKSIRDKDLVIRLTGNCKNCPSSQITIEDIVEKTLREKLGNEIGDIRLDSSVDEDLINFAKKILNIN